VLFLKKKYRDELGSMMKEANSTILKDGFEGKFLGKYRYSMKSTSCFICNNRLLSELLLDIAQKSGFSRGG
jgi:hypothetical protein